VRHEALEEAAIGAGVEWILMAHHADDVLETLLMRLGRGVASRGLSGIPWVRRGWRSRTVRVARPLLLATHSELRALCDRLGVPHSRDPGNVSPLSARGVLRRSVTGPLRERWSGVAKHAARAADASRAGAWALRELARRDGWSSESIPRSAFRTAGSLRAAALLICGVRLRGMELAPAAARRIAETACDASSEPRSVESKGAHATIGARTVRITATRGQVH
jgi:tRNA(Ile)-lysidine synthase TilS/MesJ